MSDTTGISWTDHTFNPWWGCTKVSPACDNCYAATMASNRKMDVWGPKTPRRLTTEANRRTPLAWERKAAKLGKTSRVFTLSMGDVMDGEVPEAWRDELWSIIDQTPNLHWQLLTKRPENYSRFLPLSFKHNNVWLGTTAENQYYFDLRWPAMLRLKDRFPAAPLWISYEPALGPISLRHHSKKPDWIIFGGESGPGAREMNVAWARSMRDECAEFDLTFFMKQMSSKSLLMAKITIPDDLKIRQYPDDRHAAWREPLPKPPTLRGAARVLKGARAALELTQIVIAS